MTLLLEKGKNMKKLLFSTTALTLTGLLLAGCGDESTDDKGETKTEQTTTSVSDDKAKAEETAENTYVEPVSIFAKDAEAVEDKTLKQKAQYILKKHPNTLVEQSFYMEGIAKEPRELYYEDDYQKFFKFITEDYMRGNQKQVDDRKGALIKIYSARLVETFGDQSGYKELEKFAKCYKVVVQDYYLGYDKKDKTKSSVESHQRSLDKSFKNLMESLK